MLEERVHEHILGPLQNPFMMCGALRDNRPKRQVTGSTHLIIHINQKDTTQKDTTHESERHHKRQYLDEGCKAVGCAGSVGDDGVGVLVLVSVDTDHVGGDIAALGGGSDQHLLGTSLHERKVVSTLRSPACSNGFPLLYLLYSMFLRQLFACTDFHPTLKLMVVRPPSGSQA